MSFRTSMELLRSFQSAMAGLTFGMWQGNISAGVFIFATLMTLDLIVTCGVERAKA